MRIALCSFGGGEANYRESVIRIEKQAIAAGYFDCIYCFTDETAPASMQNEFQNRKDFYSQRGFGYWTWKPLLVEYALEQIEEGDILFYVDAGCQISSYGQGRFEEYVDFIVKNNSIFFHMPQYLEKSYTAKKIIEFLGAPNEYLEQPQVQATFFGLKKTKQSRELIEAWKSTCIMDNGHYINDENIIPADPSYVDYRHDQSILSLLVKMRGNFTLPHECHHRPVDYYPNSSIMRFPIHSVRNRMGYCKDSHAFNYSFCKVIHSEAITYRLIKYLFKLIYLPPKFFRFIKNRWRLFK